MENAICHTLLPPDPVQGLTIAAPLLVPLSANLLVAAFRGPPLTARANTVVACGVLFRFDH